MVNVKKWRGIKIYIHLKGNPKNLVSSSKTIPKIKIWLKHFVSVSGESVSACFNNTQKSLQLNCGTGYMLRITNAFYGYSYRGQCSFSPGDCTQLEHETYPCIGRDSCSINLPSGNYGQRIPACDKYSTYFQVEYSCVPGRLDSYNL